MESGYSGLSSFSLLEPDVAKLDMALIRGIASDTTKQTLVRTMVQMCRDLNIAVIAEGVEAAEERDTLVDFWLRPAAGAPVRAPGRGVPSTDLLRAFRDTQTARNGLQ